jgi:ribosomal protein S18 acetylase RimI-like enzyme
MGTPQDYLEAYDRQLRTDAETPNAAAVARLGPLSLVTFPGGRGFVTYRDLGDAGGPAIARWVEAALAHYRADPLITSVEWKTRGHDRAPGLHEALVANGFVPEETESIMIGEATLLAVDIALPEGVHLRRVTSEPDVRALSEMQEQVFGGRFADGMAEALLRRLGFGDGMELWMAEAGGEIVSSGRLEPVEGTEFAGIWGGATRPEWRRRGIYRALTAARARSALARGKRLIHSDSTAGSRPILERAGLVKVSTTTPYEWRAAGNHSA